jgi:hypothetical protein
VTEYTDIFTFGGYCEFSKVMVPFYIPMSSTERPLAPHCCTLEISHFQGLVILMGRVVVVCCGFNFHFSEKRKS